MFHLKTFKKAQQTFGKSKPTCSLSKFDLRCTVSVKQGLVEHHFSNIKRTQTFSSIGDRTRTPYFWLRTNEHNRSFTRFTRLLIELTQTSFFRTLNKLERVYLLVIDLKTTQKASNHRTLNFEHNSTNHYCTMVFTFGIFHTEHSVAKLSKKLKLLQKCETWMGYVFLTAHP